MNILFKAIEDKFRSTEEKIVTGFLISENKIEDRANVGKNKCPSCQKIFEDKIDIEELDASYIRMTCPYCKKSYEGKRNYFYINQGDIYTIKPKTLAISFDKGLTWHSNLDNLNNMLNLLKK